MAPIDFMAGVLLTVGLFSCLTAALAYWECDRGRWSAAASRQLIV